MSTLYSVVTRRGETKPQRIRFSLDTIPEAISSQTGMSTTFALPRKCPESLSTKNKVAHRYVTRCAYGRERRFKFFSEQGIETFYFTITYRKTIDGKKKTMEESRLPNCLLTFETFEQLKVYVYDNNQSDTKYLRFYYNKGYNANQEPMIIPEQQMSSLMKICKIDAEDKHLEPYVVEKFKSGSLVRVTDGPYKGIEGVVKRYKGQQRLGVVIDDLFTITTSCISKEKFEYITYDNKKI